MIRGPASWVPPILPFSGNSHIAITAPLCAFTNFAADLSFHNTSVPSLMPVTQSLIKNVLDTTVRHFIVLLLYKPPLHCNSPPAALVEGKSQNFICPLPPLTNLPSLPTFNVRTSTPRPALPLPTSAPVCAL